MPSETASSLHPPRGYSIFENALAKLENLLAEKANEP
jgi:hypothetical protein